MAVVIRSVPCVGSSSWVAACHRSVVGQGGGGVGARGLFLYVRGEGVGGGVGIGAVGLRLWGSWGGSKGTKGQAVMMAGAVGRGRLSTTRWQRRSRRRQRQRWGGAFNSAVTQASHSCHVKDNRGKVGRALRGRFRQERGRGRHVRCALIDEVKRPREGMRVHQHICPLVVCQY